MRRTAGFLKALHTILVVLEVIALFGITAAFVVLLAAGNLEELAKKVGETISVEGITLTPAQMEALRLPLLIAFGVGVLTTVLALISTLKLRKVLGECKEERPFSDESVNGLKSAARLEMLGGLISIAASVAIGFGLKKAELGVVNASSTTASINLGFLFSAAVLYLLHHVAAYGNRLENR
jgi:hypothetical protein